MNSGIRRRVLATAMLLGLPASVLAGWGDLNMPVGVTEISSKVHDLHMTVFLICCAIGAAVFAVMFYSIVRHRKSKGAVASDFHESTKVEIAWTVVPLVILVGMAIPAAKVLIEMEDFSESDMSIKVTGYQWRWQYEYLDEGISFYSQLDADQNAARQADSGIDVNSFDNYLREVDNPLVVPVGQKIRFLHTAADVIHSWWVEDLAVKKDSIPGFINENWAKIDKPGTYRGKCAELCGRDHGFMPIVVKALPQDEYDAWVSEQKEKMASASADGTRNWQHEELVSAGAKVYQANCMSCHQKDGQGIPGMFPAIAGSEVVTGDIGQHANTILHGVNDTPMQAFSSRLSDTELAAVVTYQRNALGNAVGDSLQPTEIEALRAGNRQTSLNLNNATLNGVN